jgi:adenine-specific DNA glycosylase
MLAITDGDDAYELHMNLIRHGRLICRPQPRCEECALRRLCPWWRENRAPGSVAAEGGSGAPGTARKAGAGR